MIAYPRWKIALVAIVLLIGILLAVPNLFGEENALQLARDRAAVQEADRTSVVQLLKDKGVAVDGAFLDQGRLTLRFADKQDQLKARDLIAEAKPNEYTIALTQASRGSLIVSFIPFALATAIASAIAASAQRSSSGEL